MNSDPQTPTLGAATIVDPKPVAPCDATPEPADGRFFARYRVERELGRGGMGVVLLVHDEELDQCVALKILPTAVARDPESISQLKSEVLRGMALQHTGIVRVHTFERDEQAAAIVMEYVSGSTLADLKAREPAGCFDPNQIEPWIEQLCAVLDYAHGEAHIAHRDLKPRNIMITADGRLKVADFGLAAVLGETLSRTDPNSSCVGTPPYMSPQQVRGSRPTSADDIYALGATIYELLTTRPPFFRGDVFNQVIHDDAPTMAARREELGVRGKATIPRAWEYAVASCLAKEPGQRPANAAAVLALLRELDDMPAAAEIRIQRPAPQSRAADVMEPAPDPPASTHRNTPKAEPPSDPNLRWQEIPLSQNQKEGPGILVPLAAILVASALVAGVLHFVRHRESPQPKPAPVVTQPSTPTAAPAPLKALAPASLQPSRVPDASRR